ncbi:MAG: flavin-containing monooxygenase, partial [Caulobacteraceae bacterium]
YLDDPYVGPGFTRAPLTNEIDVVVIGGGFGGLLAAARLREAGVKGIRIVEKGGDFGGTWYWNRYPGAACDIESYIYLPLLEEIGYLPVEKYSRAAEILAHAQAIGRHFDLYRDACFQTQVTQLQWDEAADRWIVSTDHGDGLRARFVVMANGPLNRPKLPGIPGVGTFAGHSFHTSRWDYAYTGGDAGGNLTGLADKRVGIIGTGATAVQCVPHLAAGAKHLFVFQRTPSSIDVRANRPTDPDWAASLTPGWQKKRMDNFNVLVSGGVQEEDLVADGWTDIIGNLLFLARKKRAAGESAGDPVALMQLADFRKMEQVRARVDAIVERPATAAALKPWYNQFCKRPCFHDEYLDAFNRPNVTLVDNRRARGRGDRAARGGRRRARLRSRLPDLRHRLRGRRRLQPSRRLRDLWARRRFTGRQVGRRRRHPARPDERRLSQPLRHEQFTVRLHRQLSAHDERAGAPPGLYRGSMRRPPGARRRTLDGRRGSLGSGGGRLRRPAPEIPGGLHPRLLQQRRQTLGPGRPQRALWRRPDRVCKNPRNLARGRAVGGR